MVTTRVHILIPYMVEQSAWSMAMECRSQVPKGGSALLKVRKVYGDGRHNAFTSLVRWRGRFYLAFRSGTRHVRPGYPDGEIRILCSKDEGDSWDQVALLRSPELDMRDPRLLAVADRLFVHSFGYRDPGRRDAFVSYTEDGHSFTPFQRAVAEDNMVIWWPVQHAGEFHAGGYRYHGNKKDIRSVFYRSDDGLRWECVSVVHDVPWANESALVMEADGSATMLVRNEGQRLDPPASDGRPVIARAKPPYRRWTAHKLDRVVQGFAIHRLAAGYLVAGRIYEDEATHTAVFFCDGSRLTRLCTLPSGGDTAYPGIVEEAGRVWMSYYSSHEEEEGTHRPASIYLAEFDLSVLRQEAGV